jgi:hypothetical protein
MPVYILASPPVGRDITELHKGNKITLRIKIRHARVNARHDS